MNLKIFTTFCLIAAVMLAPATVSAQVRASQILEGSQINTTITTDCPFGYSSQSIGNQVYCVQDTSLTQSGYANDYYNYLSDAYSTNAINNQNYGYVQTTYDPADVFIDPASTSLFNAGTLNATYQNTINYNPADYSAFQTGAGLPINYQSTTDYTSSTGSYNTGLSNINNTAYTGFTSEELARLQNLLVRLQKLSVLLQEYKLITAQQVATGARSPQCRFPLGAIVFSSSRSATGWTNVRSTPGGSQAVGIIAVNGGQAVVVDNQAVSVGGNTWCLVQLPSGQVGYAAESFLR